MGRKVKEYLSSKQKDLLKEFLNLAENKDKVFTLSAVEGFLFGIAISPYPIAPSRWVPVIFDGPPPAFENKEQFTTLMYNLLDCYNSYISAFNNNELSFPFDIENPTEDFLKDLTDWVAGFLEAILLTPDVWGFNLKELDSMNYYDEKSMDAFLSFAFLFSFLKPEEGEKIFVKKTKIMKDQKEFYTTVYWALPSAVETLKNYGLEIAKERFK